MPSILITAFEPFGGESVNPTGLILSALPDISCGCEVKKLLLPVEFISAPRLAVEAIDRLAPSAVLMFGQAGGRACVTPERIAVNIMDASIPDNAGLRPQGEQVVPGGPAAYFAALPVARIAEELTANGISAAVSNSAGAYVCNALMYSVLHHLCSKDGGEHTVPAGFIHFPFISEQIEGKDPKPPAMTLEDETRAAALILKTIAETVNSL